MELGTLITFSITAVFILILSIICILQQKILEWHRHRIDDLQLKFSDLYYKMKRGER